jgi:hypothetical protein
MAANSQHFDGMIACLRAARALLVAGALASACDDPGATAPHEAPPGRAAAVPAPGGLRRLLKREYVNSVRALLGDAAARAARPPEDASLHGFDSIAAAELSLAPSAVDAYETSARAVAQAAVDDADALARIVPCAPAGPADAPCHRQFVASFGRLAWRRPLNETEIERLVGVAQAAAATYASFEQGVAYAISALLQSPSFLYLVELGEPDPDDPAVRRLTAHELLARLSFFLLDQTPDVALLELAGGRELDADDVRSLARELLRRPEAEGTVAAFYGELLRIRSLEELSRDRALFPGFTPQLARAMKEETLRLVGDIVWTRDADARELLTADYAFVNAELADLYGVPRPEGGGFAKVELPREQMRSGLLSAPALLTRFSHPDRTSPARRGLFVRTALLCDEIPPPPPGVSTTLPEPSAPTSLRAQLQRHLDDPSCGGCHALIDPVGFALESYDAIGAFRTQENGFVIVASAEHVSGIGTFATARELGALLHDDPRASRCTVQSLLRSALGHLETPGEQPAVDALDEAFAASGYKVRQLLVELAASPAFMLVGEPK